MIVRSYETSDAAALAKLFHSAVHEIAASHYTPEQLLAWSPAIPPAAIIDRWATDGRLFLIAEDEHGPAAFDDLETNGHLDHLFCRPDRAGQGVTARLYAALEEGARNRGIGLIFVEASEAARRFFLRQGFAVEARRDSKSAAWRSTTTGWSSGYKADHALDPSRLRAPKAPLNG